MAKMQYDENAWSDWVDCNEGIISDMPQTAGVYMMHTAMRILCIRGTENIKTGIREQILQPCITDNTRLRYMETPSYEEVADDLIREYKSRHDGEMPSCMQE